MSSNHAPAADRASTFSESGQVPTQPPDKLSSNLLSQNSLSRLQNDQSFDPSNPNSLHLDQNWHGLLMDSNPDFYNFDFNMPLVPAPQNHSNGPPPAGKTHSTRDQITSNDSTTSNPDLNSVKLGQNRDLPKHLQPNQDSNIPLSLLSSQNGHLLAQQRSDPLALGPGSSNTVSFDETPTNRAMKARRPCDHCRRRKTKCVIIPNTNNCAQCEAKSLVCTYIDNPVKRGNSNLNLDEYGSQSTGSGAPGPGGTAAPGKRTKLSNPTHANDHYLTQIGGNTSQFSTAYNNNQQIVPPNVQIREVPPVQDYLMVNNSLLKKTLSLQFPRLSFYIGPTLYLYDMNLLNLIIDAQNKANINPSGPGASLNPLASGKIEQVNLNESILLRKVSEKALFVLKDDQLPQSYLAMSQDVDTIEKFIAPHGQILIDLYFRIIHPLYPILHKKVFLEKYSRTHREFLAPLLAAVYVLAIQWWDYDPQLNRYPKPNLELILKIALNNYVLEILKRPKLSAVQAGLLLLQCKHILQVSHYGSKNPTNNGPGNGNNNSNSGQNGWNSTDSDYNEWVLCLQIVSLAEELGLGLDCHGWKLPKWERGLRKRLAWAVYMEDKWLALKNSRPLHIHERNWLVLPLADEDFPEKHGDGDLKEGSSDIDNGKKIFRNLIDLSMILSDIQDQFFSMKAMAEVTQMDQVLKLAKPLQLRLRNWYHLLPIELQMSSVQPRKLCLNGYLQLAYFATELTLHRKIITTVLQQQRSLNPPQVELVNVCRAAARTRLLASIDFVRDLKPEHIHSFWHSSSSSNFTLIGIFAALLFVLSSTKEEEDFYKDQVFNYRWILKISSKGFDQVGAALLQLDLVLNHIPGLLIDKVGMPMVVPNVPTIDYKKQQQHQLLPQMQGNQNIQNQGQNNNQQRPPLTSGQSSSSVQNLASPANQNSNSQGSFRKNDKRMLLQLRQGNLPFMSSPQNYTTPPYSVLSGPIQNRQALYVNSPQSSLGLSPKEIMRQRLTGMSTGSANELDESIHDVKSPALSHTSNGPSIHHSDDNRSVHSNNGTN